MWTGFTYGYGRVKGTSKHENGNCFCVKKGTYLLQRNYQLSERDYFTELRKGKQSRSNSHLRSSTSAK
jgi:hypothetical protein